MPSKLNERGLSLIEILAVLVLIGIFSILIWRFFFQATELNSREITQNSLQQESNLIVNTLHQTHTKEEIKSLYTNAENTQLIITIEDKDPIVFNKSGILYEIIAKDEDEEELSNTENWPKSAFTLHIKLTSSNNEKISYSTGSTFSKIKGSK